MWPLPATAATKVVVVGGPDAADLVEAELSGIPDWVAVSRAELGQVSGKQALASSARIGLLAGADVIVSVSRLEQMRFDLAKADLAAGIGVVTVATRNLNNPEPRVLFRGPPRSAAQAECA